jgi:hypothetical protein
VPDGAKICELHLCYRSDGPVVVARQRRGMVIDYVGNTGTPASLPSLPPVSTCI